MKKTIIITLAIILIGAVGTYLYITRPAPAPTLTTNEADINNFETKELVNSTDSLKSDASTVQKELINNQVFNIVSSQSKASFSLNELLRGSPKLVVGVTNTLKGEISVTFSPANVSLGDISINARSLKTDSEKRDGAISRLILHSDKPENEFITFSSAVVTGLPSKIKKDQKFNFTATGDIKINGITKKVSFTGNGVVSSTNVFTGNATAMINHSDFNIKIPDFDFLANVDTKSKIDIEFVAK